MANIFLASDHHLSHSNILTFLRPDGTLVRPGFDNVEEMNEYIITRHNYEVRPNDKVYFLGDVVFSNKYLHLVGRMNGQKVLIKGNHDKLKVSQYMQYFKDIRGSHQLGKLLLTHIPVHPFSLSRWKANVHGHLHTFVVPDPNGDPDPRYLNVSMEQLDDYTPVSLEDLKSRLDL